MSKKYKLVNKQPNGLYQIEALRDIPLHGVKKGDSGGYVKSESNLSHEGDAWVYGDARVSGHAEVSGNAWVFGHAEVFGDARVYGGAWVSGNAWVYGNARVSGDARVYGNAQVFGHAQVYGNAWVYGDARVSGNAYVSGDARVYGDAEVSGHAEVTKPYGCIVIPHKHSITLTTHVQIGSQQYTFEEFYGTCVEQALAEDYTEHEYQELRDILIPLMIRMERISNDI